MLTLYVLNMLDYEVKYKVSFIQWINELLKTIGLHNQIDFEIMSWKCNLNA